MKKIAKAIACLGFALLASCSSSRGHTPYTPATVSTPTAASTPATTSERSIESKTNSREPIPVASSESSSQKASSSESSSKPSKRDYLSSQIKELGGGGYALVATLENGKGKITIDPSLMVRFSYKDGDYRDQLTCEITWGLESLQANGTMTYSGVNGAQYFCNTCTQVMVVDYTIGATSASVRTYVTSGYTAYSSDILDSTRSVVNTTISFVNRILASY